MNSDENNKRGKPHVRFDEVGTEKVKGGLVPSNEIALIKIVEQAAF
ncbi:hypothetical protein OB236_07835 [Paenibacillus sp. WQ 127069]|uniref:Uncharacterized protein n=1 Tax=Paenibacillus baimaensis TaxID=2982185 RepID=A0ABT2UD39_9BACL|nr:hypothetical protein [Paenibacillus sp. WQ 127069]MCU6792036.1 hypothetical protein [Paenibacillus sp. WQ 127069]